jgi:hypothetical protein
VGGGGEGRGCDGKCPFKRCSRGRGRGGDGRRPFDGVELGTNVGDRRSDRMARDGQYRPGADVCGQAMHPDAKQRWQGWLPGAPPGAVPSGGG